MSEFQQYQFQTIDRPLTEKERVEINTWSSRASASATSVTFTYHYGDFRKDEEQVLAKYFDAMLYVANWGTKRLMFRFPKKLINEKELAAYAISPEYATSHLKVFKRGSFIILDINLNEEGGGGWIGDDEYQLGDFLALREQIINGDYRCLMMAWLKIAEENQEMKTEEYEEATGKEQVQPTIPPGLKKLTASLTAFQSFFEIYDDLLTDVIKKSKPITKKKLDYAKLITKLPAKEKKEFLLRLANGEARLAVQLRKRLEQLGD